MQLIETIRRSRNGVVLADIKNCYEGIEADCGSMIVGGDIIAVKNKVEFKSLVLYPRGRPFLTKLSGTLLSYVFSCSCCECSLSTATTYPPPLNFFCNFSQVL